ncbi:MAG TPA: DUF2752 domain-containing protein [Bacteroidales bacterium]|jgi:hypothetical protein|nr:DUF2752 domain-containing protein [Bacteroidales bacterium]HOM36817.1 DUF2752 domain-containing protein [Bacteroidales bacterium]HPD24573.1 DUF2752 domain-containing protein [Bacteroidales bacterium]HRS99190.1 DUF2752 domain-containing protein [Bacteroidales bacterium]HRT80626.1 DUF2752 domain-containing protein [Bacteroidales bacterium]
MEVLEIMKEDHSKINRIFLIILKYLRKHFLLSAIAVYYLIGFALYYLAKIDILIPCIYYSIFNIRCPGCGLTRAFMDLLQLNFAEAWQHNPLIFIVFPGLSYYVIKDFVGFVKEHKENNK